MISMIPAQYLAFSVDQVVSLFFKFLFSIGIFYPAGEPISLHLLCCGPFAVGYHSFMGRRLASAVSSTREQSRSNSGLFIEKDRKA